MTLLRVRAARLGGGRDGLRDIGDQFIALPVGQTQPPEQARHFGLVVDAKERVRATLQHARVTLQTSGAVDFFDPWSNHVQVVDYREIQLTRMPSVLRAMCIDQRAKTDAAREELRRNGVTD